MRLVVDDVDVDVATFERIDTGTSVDRVLVLIDLYGSVSFVRSILITSQIVKVKPVRLTTLARHNTNPADVSTRVLAGQDLEWRCPQVLVGPIKLDFFKGHKKIDQTQRAITIDSGVNSSFLQ